MRRERRRGSDGIGKGGVLELQDDVETTAAHRGLQSTPESMRGVDRNVSRRDRAACSERTGTDNAGIEVSVDRQKESREKAVDAAVAEGEEYVRRAGPWRG